MQGQTGVLLLESVTPVVRAIQGMERWGSALGEATEATEGMECSVEWQGGGSGEESAWSGSVSAAVAVTRARPGAVRGAVDNAPAARPSPPSAPLPSWLDDNGPRSQPRASTTAGEAAQRWVWAEEGGRAYGAAAAPAVRRTASASASASSRVSASASASVRLSVSPPPPAAAADAAAAAAKGKGKGQKRGKDGTAGKARGRPEEQDDQDEVEEENQEDPESTKPGESPDSREAVLRLLHSPFRSYRPGDSTLWAGGADRTRKFGGRKSTMGGDVGGGGGRAWARGEEEDGWGGVPGPARQRSSSPSKSASIGREGRSTSQGSPSRPRPSSAAAAATSSSSVSSSFAAAAPQSPPRIKTSGSQGQGSPASPGFLAKRKRPLSADPGPRGAGAGKRATAADDDKWEFKG